MSTAAFELHGRARPCSLLLIRRSLQNLPAHRKKPLKKQKRHSPQVPAALRGDQHAARVGCQRPVGDGLLGRDGVVERLDAQQRHAHRGDGQGGGGACACVWRGSTIGMARHSLVFLKHMH